MRNGVLRFALLGSTAFIWAGIWAGSWSMPVCALDLEDSDLLSFATNVAAEKDRKELLSRSTELNRLILEAKKSKIEAKQTKDEDLLRVAREIREVEAQNKLIQRIEEQVFRKKDLAKTVSDWFTPNAQDLSLEAGLMVTPVVDASTNPTRMTSTLKLDPQSKLLAGLFDSKELKNLSSADKQRVIDEALKALDFPKEPSNASKLRTYFAKDSAQLRKEEAALRLAAKKNEVDEIKNAEFDADRKVRDFDLKLRLLKAALSANLKSSEDPCVVVVSAVGWKDFPSDVKESCAHVAPKKQEKVMAEAAEEKGESEREKQLLAQNAQMHAQLQMANCRQTMQQQFLQAQQNDQLAKLLSPLVEGINKQLDAIPNNVTQSSLYNFYHSEVPDDTLPDNLMDPINGNVMKDLTDRALRLVRAQQYNVNSLMEERAKLERVIAGITAVTQRVDAMTGRPVMLEGQQAVDFETRLVGLQEQIRKNPAFASLRPMLTKTGLLIGAINARLAEIKAEAPSIKTLGNKTSATQVPGDSVIYRTPETQGVDSSRVNIPQNDGGRAPAVQGGSVRRRPGTRSTEDERRNQNQNNRSNLVR